MVMTEMEFNSTDILDFERNRTVLGMDKYSFFVINGPLVIVNLIANAFFVFCLVAPKTRPLKQPLTLLLGSLVSFTILYLLSVTLMICFLEPFTAYAVYTISFIIVDFMLRVNRNSYVWMMFYYYIMIIPFQRAFLLWLKTNIKSVIYIIMFFDVLIFLGDASFQIYDVLVLDDSRYSNGTFDYTVRIVVFSIVTTYIFIGLLVMMISCFAMAYYLKKHMTSLACMMDGSRMNPSLDSHIRVTVTGLLQGALCCLFFIWSFVDVMFLYFSPYFHFDRYSDLTVIDLYTTGTTVNLGVGQTLFRERAIRVWRAVKKRLCNRDSSKDLRPAGHQLKSP